MVRALIRPVLGAVAWCALGAVIRFVLGADWPSSALGGASSFAGMAWPKGKAKAKANVPAKVADKRAAKPAVKAKASAKSRESSAPRKRPIRPSQWRWWWW